MTILLDDLGTWRNLGGLSASVDWQTYPNEALEGLSLFRVRFTGYDPIEPPLNRFYIRSIYNRVSNFVDRRWTRIWPSNEQCSIDLPYLEEFRSYQVGRWIQIRRSDRYKGYDDIVCDAITVFIDEFVPNEINKLIQLNQVSIDAIAQAVVNLQSNP